MVMFREHNIITNKMDLKELYVVKQKKRILDYLSSFLIVNFEQISHILPVFLKVTFN